MNNKDNQNKKESIDSFIQNTLHSIRNLIDANVVIGNPISVGESITIIPINKVSVGYITGGGEKTNNKKQPQLSVGSSSGFNVTPIGFISVNDNNVKYFSTSTESFPHQKILDIVDKFLVKKDNVNNGEIINE